MPRYILEEGQYTEWESLLSASKLGPQLAHNLHQLLDALTAFASSQTQAT